MNWIAIVKAILSLLPAIIAAIKAIEEALPESNKGVEKLSLVRAIIESVSKESADLWPYIEKTINVLVGWFNTNGIFKKTP